jgi:hypothetical protein
MKKIVKKTLATWDCYVCPTHLIQKRTEDFDDFNDRVFEHTETHRKAGIFPRIPREDLPTIRRL